jgi:FkbM family methyltransferase
MNSTVQETTLSDGSRIFCLSAREAKFSYQQVQEYLKNGLELHEGDIVFDVGANVGIFSLWISRLFNNNITIYSFEPIPTIFEVLRRNALRFNPDNIKLFPYGLSQESKTITFTFFPNATMLSSAYPDLSDQARSKFRELVLRNEKNALPPFLAWLRWVPSFLKPFVLDWVTKSASRGEIVNCKVRSLSEVIREYQIQKIDLLKVDVEKSELPVLLGIESQDWVKIKQVFIEIDDWDLAGDRIVSLLKSQGFEKIILEQEPWLKGSKMFNLYALRSGN